MECLRDWIEKRAYEVGFDAFGIAQALPTPRKAEFLQWLEAGYHADMTYLARDPERRADPRRVLPEARSIIVVGMNYRTEDPPQENGTPAAKYTPTGSVSRYAWGEDYHRVITGKLRTLCTSIREIAGSEVAARYYVDTGPLLERDIAARAGVGWIGKHGNLVSTRFGSWLFLGAILTSLDLEPDAPLTDHCGTCTACLEACPTDAFAAPYVLDARRCISYLTIEHRGAIPESLRAQMGTMVYGCDICLRVCPWNRHESPQESSPFAPRDFWRAPRLVDLLRLPPETFQEQTRRSAIRRAKWEGMLRNACVAAGNSRQPSLLGPLDPLTRHDDPGVRECALWAVGKLEVIRAGVTSDSAPGASCTR